MKTPQEIISDEELIRVHANANFGTMTPREVVDEGVRKIAVGFSSGYTMMTILMEHGLLLKPQGNKPPQLTAKGKTYARAIYEDPAALRRELAQAHEAVERLADRMDAQWSYNAGDAVRATLKSMNKGT